MGSYDRFMKNIKTLLIVGMLVIATGCAWMKTGFNSTHTTQVQTGRLFDDVAPEKYHLRLWADPRNEGFSGLVEIDVLLKTNRASILLHGQDLQVSSVKVFGQQDSFIASFASLNDEGLARIDFGRVLEAGKYRLSIAYEGQYQKDLSGLYRVKEGNEFYVYTQFEPLSARKMLPCFDEPRFKAPFVVTVISPKEHVVIANNPEKESTQDGAHQVHVFTETPPISTYLLALAVGPFDVVKGRTLYNNKYRSEAVQFRAIATKGKGKNLEFALRETPQIVEKLEAYFNAAYPYKKLDILAVPDFAAGAMENVGAITFREWYVLLNGKTASVEQKRGFYLVMAHELAHQWFGNSVTMPWWDDLWLNEAFATWLSYKIVDQIKPQFRVAERLLARSHDVMTKDSLIAARIIRQPIQSTHDIHNAFDGITYSKGGAVLSMLENYLGQEPFRLAVSSHIKRFQSGTASSKDFLQSLAQYSDPSLIKSTESFLNQAGVPMVHMSYACTDKGLLTVNLEQKRYVPLGSRVESDRRWHIPLCFGYESNGGLKKHCLILGDTSMVVTLENQRCPAFVMPNYQGQGYYRFSMDIPSWTRLLAAKSSLDISSRLALADSLLANLHAGSLEFAMVSESLRGLVDVQSSLLTGFYLRLSAEALDWVSEQHQPYLADYAQESIKGMYQNHPAKSEEQRELHKKIVQFLVHVAKDEQVRLQLSAMADTYLKSLVGKGSIQQKKPIDENLLGDALAVLLQAKSDEELKTVIKKLETQTDTVTRERMLYAIALSRQGDAGDFVRQTIFNKSLRKNEQLHLLYNHLSHRNNQPATWEFLKANVGDFKRELSKQQMSNLPYLVAGLCSKEYAKEVEQFFSPFIAQYQGGPRVLGEMLEQINICAARKMHLSVMADKFLQNLKDKSVAERQ
jgi:cytosol alanyl aminopeptidase